MAEGSQEHEPQITLLEGIFWSVWFLVLDIADFFSFGIPVTDAFSWPVQIYLKNRKVPGTYSLIGNILELIPGADYIFWRTIAWIITLLVDHFPDSMLARWVQKASEVQEVASSKGVPVPGGKGPGGGSKVVPKGKRAVLESRQKAGIATAAGQPAEEAAGRGRSAKRTPRQGREPNQERGAYSSNDNQEQVAEDSGKPEPSPEEQELENILKGDFVGNVLLNTLGTKLVSEMASPANDNSSRVAGKSKPGKLRDDRLVDLRDAA